MSGYDRRIGSTFVGFGYETFPFQSFDDSGHLRVPDSYRLPAARRSALARVAEKPVWTGIYRTLSVLDDPQWNAFCAGVGATDSHIDVVVFKNAYSVRGAEAAHQWMLSYQEVIARTIRSYAGTNHLVDPAWLEAIDSAIGELPASESSQDPAGKQPGDGQEIPVGPLEPASADVLAIVPWVLLGLRALRRVLQMGRRTEVRTTVFWYRPDGRPPLDQAFANRWTPIFNDYRLDGAIRAVSATWEPVGAQIYYGPSVRWDQWLWTMPQTPEQWYRAFWPTGSVAGRESGGSAPADARPELVRADADDGVPHLDPADPNEAETTGS